MRIPALLKKQYPESRDNILEVIIQVPEIHPGEECAIDVTLRDLSQELYYRTGIVVLDDCILDIHQSLLGYGVPVDPDHDKYQKVLVHLLLYRQNCALYPDYISADIATMTENAGFHKHLYSKLIDQLSIEAIGHVFSEVDIGNSRVDLLIENIPTELKLEGRKKVTTDEIVESYQGQAADYIARQNAAFGFLVVLDTVLDRELPTSRVDQDIRVVQVTIVSGNSVIVVAIIVRIPRSASNFTELAKKRR